VRVCLPKRDKTSCSPQEVFLVSEKVIMSGEEIRRSLARIAHEILERNHRIENVLLVGMKTRGVPLARRLSANLVKFEDVNVPVVALDISPYRDDVPPEHRTQGNGAKEAHLILSGSEIPVDVTGKSVVLVDDVLYTGRSARAALDALIDLGRPQSIQLAVLIDRGHRELPIRPDYVGKNIPTSHDEEIQVRVLETDRVDEVLIVKSGNGQVNGHIPFAGDRAVGEVR
jgi:pyrimidine operon attenuation protein / uracil phosphoribosyltransferase